MSEAAHAYRNTAMLSEEPGMDWIIRGVTGAQTLVRRAIICIKTDDTAGRIKAVTQATALIDCMSKLVDPAGGGGDGKDLATQIKDSYTAILFSIAQANATSSIDEFNNVRAYLDKLATYLRRMEGTAD